MAAYHSVEWIYRFIQSLHEQGSWRFMKRISYISCDNPAHMDRQTDRQTLTQFHPALQMLCYILYFYSILLYFKDYWFYNPERTGTLRPSSATLGCVSRDGRAGSPRLLSSALLGAVGSLPSRSPWSVSLLSDSLRLLPALCCSLWPVWRTCSDTSLRWEV